MTFILLCQELRSQRDFCAASYLKSSSILEEYRSEGLFIKPHTTTPDGDAYQLTYYRIVLDVNTGAIWLFYEYYQFDPDLKEEKEKEG